MAHIAPTTLRLDGGSCRPLLCVSAPTVPPIHPWTLFALATRCSILNTSPGEGWFCWLPQLQCMASMACVFFVEEGIQDVEVKEDAGLIAILESDFSESYYTQHYSSVDGGFTWALESNEPETNDELNRDVHTPRGQYVLEGSDIVRVGLKNERVTVYSSAYLQQPGNRWIQGNDTAHFSDFLSERVLASEPLSIAHDPTTGNVVVAMGLQGAVVGTPDEQWQPTAVGPYTPHGFLVRRQEHATSFQPSILVGIHRLDPVDAWAFPVLFAAK